MGWVAWDHAMGLPRITGRLRSECNSSRGHERDTAQRALHTLLRTLLHAQVVHTAAPVVPHATRLHRTQLVVRCVLVLGKAAAAQSVRCRSLIHLQIGPRLEQSQPAPHRPATLRREGTACRERIYELRVSWGRHTRQHSARAAHRLCTADEPAGRCARHLLLGGPRVGRQDLDLMRRVNFC